MTVSVEIDALKDAVDYFQRLPETSGKAMSIAINQVMQRQGMRHLRDSIMDQVAFPKDYLTGDRLQVSQFAAPNKLEGVIVARKRATSLARFAQGAPLNRVGISVKVSGKGGTTALRSSWLVRLKKGASLSEDSYNVGLAVRLKPGETIDHKVSDHKSWLVKPTDTRGGVALLYGPSVDQVFRSVADESGEAILGQVSDEFYRQFRRLTS